MCPVLPVTSPPLLVQEGRSPSTRLCDAVRSGPVGADHQAPLGVGRNRSVPSRCECVRVAPFQYEDVEGASRTETALPTRQCIKGGSGADGSWSRRRARICSARTAVQTSTIPCCSTASAAAPAASRSFLDRPLLLEAPAVGQRRASSRAPLEVPWLSPSCRDRTTTTVTWSCDGEASPPPAPVPSAGLSTGEEESFASGAGNGSRGSLLGEAVGRKFTLGRPPPRARQ
jgi:hypothetical protein